jgi:hypothetical protein
MGMARLLHLWRGHCRESAPARLSEAMEKDGALRERIAALGRRLSAAAREAAHYHFNHRHRRFTTVAQLRPRYLGIYVRNGTATGPGVTAQALWDVKTVSRVEGSFPAAGLLLTEDEARVAVGVSTTIYPPVPVLHPSQRPMPEP